MVCTADDKARQKCRPVTKTRSKFRLPQDSYLLCGPHMLLVTSIADTVHLLTSVGHAAAAKHTNLPSKLYPRQLTQLAP